MCIGIPAKVVKIKNQQAQVKQGGHTHWIGYPLVADLAVGDWVLTYQDTVINKISASEAQRAIRLLQGE